MNAVVNAGAAGRALGNDSGFSLTKWYLDCVSPEGEAVIAYAARLRAHIVRASYSSVLEFRGGKVEERSSMRRFPAIEGEADIALELPQLRVSGRWSAQKPALHCAVFDSPEGAVSWDCLQPRSAVSVECGDSQMNGTGYAECLSLTIPPWRLPMRGLLWGRFHSQNETVIWIDWQGEYNKRIVFRNGMPAEIRRIDERAMEFDDGATLQFGCEHTLRCGALGDTIVPGAPLLKTLFPGSMLAVSETKWLSRGVFEQQGRTESAWAIHEVVEWNR